MSAPTCGSCKYARKYDSQVVGQDQLVCHRYPPTPTLLINPANGAVTNFSNFPIMRAEQFCGEYEPATLGKPRVV